MSQPHHSVVQHGAHVVLQLPSGLLKPVQIEKNAAISIGKYGTFNSNSILGRPYFLTYEFLEREEGSKYPKLRIVHAAELNSEEVSSGSDTPVQDEKWQIAGFENDGNEFDMVGENRKAVMRSNQFTVDDSSRQTLTTSDIEELKKAGTGSGKEIIERIMASHSAIDEKTKFSLAKYTLRKSKKYIKRFTVMPMDVNILTEFMLEKEPQKIMELRPEILGLMTCWAHVHHGGNVSVDETQPIVGGGRWLVVDDSAGLLVAAIADKMGILYGRDENTRNQELDELWRRVKGDDQTSEQLNGETDESQRSFKARELYQAAETNTITVVNGNAQPNLSLLNYFGFNTDDSFSTHPLHTNLRTLTWLQLLDPEADRSYTEEPETVTAEELAEWKTSRRGAFYRKRRRWERTRRVVDRTRQGGFDGLVVASWMKLDGVLKHLVPLVKSGGQIVVYSPTVESLTEIMDDYSKERRAAYVSRMAGIQNGDMDFLDNDPEFPVDPSLILQPNMQSTRAIEWQVLPMRTHPLMISRGGAEGYIFVATRVLPAQTPVAARGKFNKKRKQEGQVEKGTKRVRDEDTQSDAET